MYINISIQKCTGPILLYFLCNYQQLLIDLCEEGANLPGGVFDIIAVPITVSQSGSPTLGLLQKIAVFLFIIYLLFLTISSFPQQLIHLLLFYFIQFTSHRHYKPFQIHKKISLKGINSWLSYVNNYPKLK